MAKDGRIMNGQRKEKEQRNPRKIDDESSSLKSCATLH